MCWDETVLDLNLATRKSTLPIGEPRSRVLLCVGTLQARV